MNEFVREDVRAGLEVAGVDRGDGRGLGQAEQVAVAPKVARVVGEPFAAEVGLGEPVGLEHRPHRPVEDEDPLAQEARQTPRGATRGRTRHAGTAAG